jgi:hypothetical protein
MEERNDKFKYAVVDSSHIGIGKTVMCVVPPPSFDDNIIHHYIHNGVDVVVVDEPHSSQTDYIDINGEKWIPVESNHPNIPSNPSSNIIKSKLDGIMAMGAMMYLPYLYELDTYTESKYTRKLSNDIDIINEYRLIQLKQSNLTKWERESVIHIFEKRFKKL